MFFNSNPAYRITPYQQLSEEEITRNKGQIIKLKEIKQPAQKSEEWLKMRENMLTASTIASVINQNPYQTRQDLLNEKTGIKKRKKFGSTATNKGILFEPVAGAVYEAIYQKTVHEYGLIPHPEHSFIGASPDGITEDGIMLEIKCPLSRVITGKPPIYYWMQTQIQMEVCDFEHCHFMECKFTPIKYDEFHGMATQDDDYKQYQNFLYGHVIQGENDTNTEGNIYSEIKHQYTETELTELKKKSEETPDKITFWRLDEVSIVSIARDRDWFKNNIQAFTEFWDEVLRIRKENEELAKNKKKAPFKHHLTNGVCLL